MEFTGRASRDLEGFPGCENPKGRFVLHLQPPCRETPVSWMSAGVPKIMPLSSGAKGEMGFQSSVYPQRDLRQCDLECACNEVKGLGGVGPTLVMFLEKSQWWQF